MYFYYSKTSFTISLCVCHLLVLLNHHLLCSTNTLSCNKVYILYMVYLCIVVPKVLCDIHFKLKYTFSHSLWMFCRYGMAHVCFSQERYRLAEVYIRKALAVNKRSAICCTQLALVRTCTHKDIHPYYAHT